MDRQFRAIVAHNLAILQKLATDENDTVDFYVAELFDAYYFKAPEREINKAVLKLLAAVKDCKEEYDKISYEEITESIRNIIDKRVLKY